MIAPYGEAFSAIDTTTSLVVRLWAITKVVVEASPMVTNLVVPPIEPGTSAFTHCVPSHFNIWFGVALVTITSVKSSREATVDATPGIYLFKDELYLRTFVSAGPVVSISIPPTVILGIVAMPVNVGVALFAFRSNAVCCAVDTGLAVSAVLSTEPKPTIDLVIPETVPVNVGVARGA